MMMRRSRVRREGVSRSRRRGGGEGGAASRSGPLVREAATAPAGCQLNPTTNPNYQLLLLSTNHVFLYKT